MDSKPKVRKRTAGILKSRLPDLRLGQLHDLRKQKSRRWRQEQLATATVAGLMAGCKSTADTEELTDGLSSAMRSLLKINRRLPDTTLRD